MRENLSDTYERRLEALNKGRAARIKRSARKQKLKPKLRKNRRPIIEASTRIRYQDI